MAKQDPDRSAQTCAAAAAALARLLPELAVALYESSPHHRDGHPAAAGEPLTARQMEAVVLLAGREGATMGELAAGLGVSRAAATELVDRLVAKGVAVRDGDPGDRRRVLVRLSPPAQRLARAQLDDWQQRLTTVCARHPQIDPDTLVALVRDLVNELKGGLRP